MKKKILILSTMCLLLSSINAQVTIGSAQKPVTGALLDLKQETDGTSKKGLGMPRVQLQDIDKLKMSATGTEYTDKMAHTGLIVYNISGNPIPKCAPIPDGLYVWDGGKWNGLGVTKIDPATLDIVPKTVFDLPSGKDARPLTAQSFTATWTPGTLPYTNTPHTTLGGIAFTGTPLTASPLATSPAVFSMTPDAMTIANVNLPWQSKESTLQFDVADECGRTVSKTVILNQTNYGLTVNGKVVPDQENITISVTGKTASISGNTRWKLSSIAPTTNSAVTSSDLNGVKGTELTDGTSATNTLSYNVTVGAAKSRYNYLTFADNESPKRFNDVVLTVAQCTGTNYLTMAQYKDLWEGMYGLTPVDEPNSNGNAVKNINQVQWHYDQNNNIFFSAIFGTERWMITNLAANTYATNSPNKPVLTQTYASAPSPYTAAYYGYPNAHGTTNAGLTTQYAARQRLGRLYNWAAATGNQNTSMADQTNTVHGPHQGICPDTWHLPSDLEWTNLMTELIASPTKYSGNTAGYSTGLTIKDMCEPTANTGKSFGILDGGFNCLFAAGAVDGSTNSFGNAGYFWSASSYSANSAWYRNLTTGFVSVSQHHPERNILISVRCKK